MINYILVALSAVFQVGCTMFQTAFQKREGASMWSGMLFNLLQSLTGALTFFIVSGFTLHITPFSAIVAAAQCILLAGYNVAGFKVMRTGGMVMFSLFLMAGGMVVPYVWGLLFLGEQFTVPHMLGLVLIVLSVFNVKTKDMKISKGTILLCVLVFFMNGFVSVASKIHQIETHYETVSTNEFVTLTNSIRFVITGAIMLCMMPRVSAPSRKMRAPKMSVLFAVLSALMGGISYWFSLTGAKELPASVLYPIMTGGTILFSTVVGLIVFKEKLSLRGWIGVAVCIAGTCLML